jgi:hypothetical protein
MCNFGYFNEPATCFTRELVNQPPETDILAHSV